MRYAFDENGHIAYRCLENADYNAPYIYEWDGYSIASDRTVLYVCETGTEIEFESMNELCAYCEEHSIELGAWYYPVGYTPMAQVIQFESGDWTIASNTWNYCVVANGNEELFSGYIDKYFSCDGYFGFHFQHIKNSACEIALNPVIEYSTDTVVGKKYAGFLFFYNDVYADKYVFVDTETDEYIIFDTKKEIKQYAKNLGAEIDWQEILY